MTDENPRPNPAGRSEIDPPRPERPKSRHQTIRPVSPFTDWSSLTDNEVISIPSDDDDDYVPRSPVYKPDSPGPVEEPQDQNQDQITMNLVLQELYFPMSPERPMRRDRDLLLVEEPSCKGFPPFKGIRTEKKTAVRGDKANVKCD